jgi:hypothetical protein
MTIFSAGMHKVMLMIADHARSIRDINAEPQLLEGPTR